MNVKEDVVLRESGNENKKKSTTEGHIQAFQGSNLSITLLKCCGQWYYSFSSSPISIPHNFFCREDYTCLPYSTQGHVSFFGQ